MAKCLLINFISDKLEVKKENAFYSSGIQIVILILVIKGTHRPQVFVRGEQFLNLDSNQQHGILQQVVHYNFVINNDQDTTPPQSDKIINYL